MHEEDTSMTVADPLPRKASPIDLARFGGAPHFSRPRSTSNLTRPDVEALLRHSRTFYDARRYTDGGLLSVELEQRLCAFHECRDAVVFSCGFWALVLAMRCLALPGRREVVMPSLTYRRMADAVAWAGLVPHFCEVDETTLGPTPSTIAPTLGDDTALILAAQPIVNCCDMPGIEQLAAARQLPLLFDSVESAYESHRGRRIGNFGRAEVFSMHASKLLNGMEGGYVTTNDPALAERLRRLRAFGADGDGMIGELGLNAKLNEVHAAFALANLDGLSASVAHNREIYRAYQQALPAIPGVRLLAFDETERCSFKNIVVELEAEWPLTRTLTLAHLNAEGVLARAYYDPPLHARTTSYETRGGPLPITDALATRFLLLPCGYMTSVQDVAEVVDLLRFLAEHADAIREREA
jgi:dTDP-4-amino-4,6-dideoxygalactose transaminase